MIRWLLLRFFGALFVIWVTVTFAFALVHVIPGDPALVMAGPQAREEDVARLRTELGLDKPVYAQYRGFVTRLVHRTARADLAHDTCSNPVLGLHVDLGKSFRYRAPVVRLLWERVPKSLGLASAALAFQLSLGILLGTLGAARSRSRLSIGALLFATFPTFLIALILQTFFGHRLRWLPLDGYGTTWREIVLAGVLPSLTLCLHGLFLTERLVQSEVSAELNKDYVRTVRAKGGSRLRALLLHALPNAAAPVLTQAGLEWGALASGTIVTETVFRWPGLGQLAAQAVQNRDSPVMVGLVLTAGIFTVMAGAIAEVLAMVFDPRSRARLATQA